MMNKYPGFLDPGYLKKMFTYVGDTGWTFWKFGLTLPYLEIVFLNFEAYPPSLNEYKTYQVNYSLVIGLFTCLWYTEIPWKHNLIEPLHLLAGPLINAHYIRFC